MSHTQGRVVVVAAFSATVLVGCGQGGTGEELASSSPSAIASGSAAPPAEMIGAAAFCELAFRDLASDLEAKCSAEPRSSAGVSALRDANEKCKTMLEASGESAGLRIENERAKVCARSVKAAFEQGVPSRGPIDFAAFEGCQEIFQGALAEGEACRTALECKAPLVCKAPEGVDKPKEGTCSRPAAAGERCWPENEALLFGARSGCHENLHCPGEPRMDGFGAGGLGLSGIGDGGSRGDGIGLGSIGTLSGPIGGTGQGFGASSRLGNARTFPPKVRMGTPQLSATRLPPEVVQRIVRQNFGRFRLCYENGLRANPALRGGVTVQFVIGRSGAVSSVGAGGSTLPDAGVVACVSKAFYGFSFPQPEGGTLKVTMPIHFLPPDPAPKPVAIAAPAESSAGIASLLPPPDAGASASVDAGPDAAREAAIAPWSGDAPPAGICRSRAEKGHGCLSSAGCASGFVCVAQQCAAPSPGQTLACQTDRDCSLWQRCGASSVTNLGNVSFGVCVDRKPAKAACKDSSECRGGCVAGACAAPCPGK